MNIAIIPARKNSTRIKNKNIKIFFSKPIIYYPIDACLNSKIFDRVIISSDSEEYFQLIKKKYKSCLFHKRTKKNSSNTATTKQLLEEIINFYDFKRDTNFCCIYPCNPLLKFKNIVKSYEVFKKKKFDFLFTIAESDIALDNIFVLKNGKLNQNFIKKNNILNSQYNKITYKDCGQLYWFKKNHIFKKTNIFKGNVGTFLLNEYEYQDINTLLDWDIAKLKFKKRFLNV